MLARTLQTSTQALAVETLLLRSCKLGDKGTQLLLGLLSEWCPYLQILDIGRNNLGQGGSAAAALETILIDESVPLSTLSLAYNNFRCYLISISTEILLKNEDFCITSDELCIQNDDFCIKMMKYVFKKLSNFLINNFREKHMARFAAAFAENTFLTHLDLSWNSVSCNGAIIIAQVTTTPQLSHIYPAIIENSDTIPCRAMGR